MFDINNISFDRNSGMHICICPCDSPHDAEYLVAKYIGVSRMFSMSGSMYHRGSEAYIEAYSYDEVVRIASYINANYFMPPLDVYVFYGSSQKGLDSRWCVGFDYPQAQVAQIINLLNTQMRFANADKDSKSWYDKNSKSYSVVILTGITNQQLTIETAEQLNQMVTLCSEAIRNTTFQEINPVMVQ